MKWRGDEETETGTIRSEETSRKSHNALKKREVQRWKNEQRTEIFWKC